MTKLKINDKIKNYSSTSYENYDYSTFWKKRNYENQSDKIAISRLFSMIKNHRNNIIDIGGGMGRITPLYENLWKEFVLLDGSQEQVDIAKKNSVHNKKAKFVVDTLPNIPFPDSTFDTALCIRTFHYISDTATSIKEINRILKPKGYFVLEIPNKLHFKNRIGAIFGKNKDYIFSMNPIDISTKDNTIFLDHNPKTISKLLKLNNFEIIKILSVSNFRSDFLKKIFPLSLLIKIEKPLQKVLAPLWFGPSIYFLARKL